MRKAFPVLFLIIFLIVGCRENNNIALQIGPVAVSAAEFEQSFKESRYVYMGDAGREMFLQQFIDKKLILMEAERVGLDKDPEFLKDIQHFWEQALLKRVVAANDKKISNQVEVTPVEIKEYYKKYQESDFQGQPLNEVYGQVKWILIKIKQSQALAVWAQDLRKKEDIKIDKALLGLK